MAKEKIKAKPKTRLIGKEYSPLIIRRYSMPVLHFVAMISDHNLDDLDIFVDEYFAKNPMQEGIQAIRNSAGGLCDFLYKKYPRTEGVAVIIQADKMTTSSLSGDFMNHQSCRTELFGLLTFATGV